MALPTWSVLTLSIGGNLYLLVSDTRSIFTGARADQVAGGKGMGLPLGGQQLAWQECASDRHVQVAVVGVWGLVVDDAEVQRLACAGAIGCARLVAAEKSTSMPRMLRETYLCTAPHKLQALRVARWHLCNPAE